MKYRTGILRERIVLLFVAFLAVPLLGWTELSKSASSGATRDSRASETAVLRSISAQASPAGNVEAGQKLFMGNLHFQNDGPPCMGCHNIGENGLLGGGAMGPDLTNVSTRRSQSELAAILSNSQAAKTPIMQPIYAEHPLTAEEQADLLAFIESSAGQPEANKELVVIGISVAGFMAAVALLGFVYRGRLRGVRKSLLRKVEHQDQ